MTKEDAKQAYALVSLYIALFKSKYNKQPMVNRYREKWAMQDVIDTVGYERARELLEYYFKCNKIGHPLNWFLYNFDRLDDMMIQSTKDKTLRSTLRKKTQIMVEQDINGELQVRPILAPEQNSEHRSKRLLSTLVDTKRRKNNTMI